MPRVKLTPSSKRARRRSYSPSALMRAYWAVKEDGVPVYRASRQYAVPLTTLRDRVDRRVPVDCTRSGPEQILSQLEESKLVAHIKRLAAVGYGYTRTDVLTMATDYAVRLGKRQDDYKCFSMQWFYNFMGRWPELRVVKPSSLSEVKARCASEESVTNYFEELDRILTRYNLKDKPQLIYNVDEKGVDTQYKPPNVVAGRGGRPQAVMAERIKSVSIIGAGNALGNRIPPFFVFPGQRMVPDLMRGKTAGADGVVTPTGWSNFQVFRDYMQDHFMKHVQCRDASDTILVLYDGHRSHVAIDLINWAKENDIVLFVLPPHRSHVLQPADVGCFWPLQLKYDQECLSFARANRRAVTRYDVCGLACKAYASALSPSNVQSAFARAGVYPFKPAEEVIKSLQPKLAPSTQHTTCRPNEQLHDASNLCSLHFGRKRCERDPTRLEPSGYFGTQARLRPEALPDASLLMPGRVSKLRPKATSLKGRMVEIVEDFLKSSDFNTGTESQLETSNSRSANIQVMVLSKVQGGVQSQQSQGSIRPIPAWLDTQGLTEESLQAAVTGLGIAILGALCAHTEPALTRVQLNSWSARKFTYTMYTELCRYMESFSAGQGSERTVVFGHVKDTEEVRAPAGVFQIKVED